MPDGETVWGASRVGAARVLGAHGPEHASPLHQRPPANHTTCLATVALQKFSQQRSRRFRVIPPPHPRPCLVSSKLPPKRPGGRDGLFLAFSTPCWTGSLVWWPAVKMHQDLWLNPHVAGRSTPGTLEALGSLSSLVSLPVDLVLRGTGTIT